MRKDNVVAAPVGSYFLVLPTREHVQVLVDVLASIGGDPDTSRRGLTAEIEQALCDLGFQHSDLDKLDYHGTVYFEEA